MQSVRCGAFEIAANLEHTDGFDHLVFLGEFAFPASKFISSEEQRHTLNFFERTCFRSF
jgi:hypothetical protein